MCNMKRLKLRQAIRQVTLTDSLTLAISCAGDRIPKFEQIWASGIQTREGSLWLIGLGIFVADGGCPDNQHRFCSEQIKGPNARKRFVTFSMRAGQCFSH